MASVEGDKAVLRGLTPPVPPATDRGQAAAIENPRPEPLPVEHTPVLTVEQSAALTAEREHARDEKAERVAMGAAGVAAPAEAEVHEEPTVQVPASAFEPPEGSVASGATGPDDRTIIAPTPLPPENAADDQTNPTADEQILDVIVASPAVPARPATLGMAAMAARAQAVPLTRKVAELARRPLALAAWQLGALVLGGALAGGLVTAGLSGTPTPPARAERATLEAGARSDEPAGAPTAGPPETNEPPALPAVPKPRPEAAAAAEPAASGPAAPKPVRKRKPPRKLAKSHVSQVGKATR